VSAAAAAPLVSVVIPAHDSARYLDECLGSVFAQQGEFELQVIVVDDASSDGTARVARAHDKVELIRFDENRGPSAARNAGIAAARGEFVAFLDSDDRWPEGKLAAQLAVLQVEPAAALVFGDCRQFDERGPRPRTEFEAAGLGTATWGSGRLVPQAYERLLEANFVTTGSVVVRRTALAAAGGFAEELRLVEDLDLWLRLARHAPIAWCAHECLERRRHDANISRDAEALGLAYLEVLRRHAPGGAAGNTGALETRIRRLAAHEWLHLADLARVRGDTASAWRRLRRGIAGHAAPSLQWQAAKTAFKLLAGIKAR
jgi:glycosyltransferase involved in cell wall biosynthesis